MGRSRMGPTALVVLALVSGLSLAACGSSSGGEAQTDGVPLTITPDPSAGYANGQKIKIVVGPNTHFAPYSSIKILQCADPGGGTAGLPKSVANCDGNTLQGGTVIVTRNGSFTEDHYMIFRLPSAELAEGPNIKPVCSATQACVLYIGENQEDFKKPKIFSAPFFVKGNGNS